MVVLRQCGNRIVFTLDIRNIFEDNFATSLQETWSSGVQSRVTSSLQALPVITFYWNHRCFNAVSRDMWRVSPLKANCSSFVVRHCLSKLHVCLTFATISWGRCLYHHPILQTRRLRDKEVLPKLLSWEVAKSEFTPRQPEGRACPSSKSLHTSSS